MTRVLFSDLTRGGEAVRFCSTLRWSVHGDWVLDLRYYPALRAIVSCSTDDRTALVIGDVIAPANPPPQTIQVTGAFDGPLSYFLFVFFF